MACLQCFLGKVESRHVLMPERSCMSSCRHALDAFENGASETFAIDRGAEHTHGIQNLKEKISETLRVFQQRGVLHEREYDERVPASLHGAPRTAEVRRILLFQQSFQRLSSEASKSCPLGHHMAFSCCLLVATLKSGTPQSTKSTSQCKSDIAAPPHRLLIDINCYTFLS